VDRLVHAQQHRSELEPVRRHLREDTLFPLGRQWLDDLLRDGVEFRPRDILIWARDAWEGEQEKLARLGGDRWLADWPGASPGPITDLQPIPLDEAIDAAVDRKVEEQVSLRKLQPGSLPPDAGNLAGLVESLLGQCRGDGRTYSFRGVERMKKRAGRLPPYDLLVREHREGDGREITTGVLFVTNAGKSATDALRRLLEDEQPPDHRLLVTDHERRPLTTGPQGAEYYRDLTKLGTETFQYIKLTFEQYAALDGLEGAVTLARVGDLEIEWPRGTIRPVTEPEVIASHHRRDRYRHHPLLRHLLTEEPLPPPLPPPPTPVLDSKDVRSFVMAQLSWRLGMSAHEVANGYLHAQPALKLGLEEVMSQVKEIVGGMHAEGLLHATPADDDLFLQLRK